MIRAIAGIVLVLGLVVAASGAARNGGEGGRFEFTRSAMGDRVRIVVHAPGEEAARAAAAAAFDRIDELDGVMSDYKPESELMRLCAEPAGTPVRVSEDLFGVLSRAVTLARATEGAFDPTIGPVVALWREARKAGELPSQERIEEALARTGHEKMVLDEGARTVTLRVEGMQLDLGGIGKGYAADAAAAVLEGRGIRSYLVAVGGDIVVGDAPPGDEGWRIGLVEPKGREVVLVRGAISTSGDAHQFVEIGGVRYSHIVDPRTGIGLTHDAVVTVSAPDSATADAVATAVSVVAGGGGGAGERVEMLRRLDGAEARGVGVRMTRRGEAGTSIWSTAGFPSLEGRVHVGRGEAEMNEPPEGFVALFNGRNLGGWTPVVADPPQLAKMSAQERAEAEASAADVAGRHWRVEDGVLHMRGGDEAWTSLRTVEEFGNFELLLEWRIEAKGDSGVYLRDCPQVQIWDHPDGSGGLYNNQKAGAKPLRVADRPVGEWNRFRILMIGDEVTVYLNGELVVDRAPLENLWDRAAGVPKRGPIWLQAHSTPLWFRNVFIRRLGE